jgi:anti-sigma regulatory factor (Ser/Thr protein kinase)
VDEWLEYVLSLAEAGLTEMRALIFELRPESLQNEGLIAALTRQAAALQARHELALHLSLCDDEPDAPLEVKEAVYRIAQEALNNTVKHAHAGRVELRLEQDAGGILLDVRDDGEGFDPAYTFFPGTPRPEVDARARREPGRNARDRERARRGHPNPCADPTEYVRVRFPARGIQWELWPHGTCPRRDLFEAAQHFPSTVWWKYISILGSSPKLTLWAIRLAPLPGIFSTGSRLGQRLILAVKQKEVI